MSPFRRAITCPQEYLYHAGIRIYIHTYAHTHIRTYVHLHTACMKREREREGEKDKEREGERERERERERGSELCSPNPLRVASSKSSKKLQNPLIREYTLNHIRDPTII